MAPIDLGSGHGLRFSLSDAQCSLVPVLGSVVPQMPPLPQGAHTWPGCWTLLVAGAAHVHLSPKAGAPSFSCCAIGCSLLTPIQRWPLADGRRMTWRCPGGYEQWLTRVYSSPAPMPLEPTTRLVPLRLWSSLGDPVEASFLETASHSVRSSALFCFPHSPRDGGSQ